MQRLFSVYGRVTEGRGSMSISNAVCLTRIALHGPPIATKAAKTYRRDTGWIDIRAGRCEMQSSIT